MICFVVSFWSTSMLASNKKFVGRPSFDIFFSISNHFQSTAFHSSPLTTGHPPYRSKISSSGWTPVKRQLSGLVHWLWTVNNKPSQMATIQHIAGQPTFLVYCCFIHTELCKYFCKFKCSRFIWLQLFEQCRLEFSIDFILGQCECRLFKFIVW